MKKNDLVVCVSNQGNEASLVRHRLYVRIPDLDAERHGMLRVVDEDDEDYLFPATFFAHPNKLKASHSKLGTVP